MSRRDPCRPQTPRSGLILASDDVGSLHHADAGEMKVDLGCRNGSSIVGECGAVATYPPCCAMCEQVRKR